MSKDMITNNSTIVNQKLFANSYEPTYDDYITPLDVNDYTPIVKIGNLFKTDTRVDYMYYWDLNGKWVKAEAQRPQHIISNNNNLITDFLNCSKEFQSELRTWVNGYSIPVTFTRDATIAALRNFLDDFNAQWNCFINQWACKYNFTTYNSFSKRLRHAVDEFYNTIFQEHGVSILKNLEDAEYDY